MTLALVAVLLAAGIAAPHVVDLRHVPAGTASLLWGAALGLRAACGVLVAGGLVLLLPTTAVFRALTHWCWHTALPLLATHLGLDGHRLGDAVVLLPAALLGVSVISISWGVLRAARAVRRALRRHELGRGPHDSVLVAGREVVLLAAGLSHPQVVVSTGALATLDDEELAAALAHERGHIARRHRWVLLYGELCRALGVFLPGGRRATRELAFHLERDADAWALRRRHDPLALAGAICKAGRGSAPTPARIHLAGSAGTRERVDELIHGPPPRGLRLTLARAGAAASVALLLSLIVALPLAAASVASAATLAVPHC